MPDSPKALLHRGNAHFKFDNPDRAIEDYEGVLRLNPDNNAAKENLQKARDKVTFLKREFGL
jgi:tetratricopeptide (TPR) repeat protein